MMNLADHTTSAGSIIDLYYLRDFTQAQGKKSALLVFGSADTTLNLLDLYCCHCEFPLSVKHFVHADATNSCDSIGVAELRQSLNCSLYEIVRVGGTF